MSYRLEKFAGTLQEALGEILGRESLDPGLRSVSVVRVQPSRDLKRVTVFIACQPGQVADALERLGRAAGFIKKQLGRKMRLRTMPEFDFEADTSLDLERKLSSLVPQENSKSEDARGLADGKENEETNR